MDEKTEIHERTILLTPNCFTPDIKITFKIPNNRDDEEYIDEFLDSILNDSCMYNAEWEFV